MKVRRSKKAKKEKKVKVREGSEGKSKSTDSYYYPEEGRQEKQNNKKEQKSLKKRRKKKRRIFLRYNIKSKDNKIQNKKQKNDVYLFVCRLSNKPRHVPVDSHLRN